MGLLKNLKSVNPEHIVTQLDNLFGFVGQLAALVEHAYPQAATFTPEVEVGSQLATGLVNGLAGIVDGLVTPAAVPAAAEGSITPPAPPVTLPAGVDPAMFAQFQAFIAAQAAQSAKAA